MLDKFNKPQRSWKFALAKVQDWLPSQRPKYKDSRTGTVYRLDKVEPRGVWLTKGCGSKREFSLAEFEKFFKRV